MKAAIFERVGVLAVTEVAEPKVEGPHDVKVAVKACGVCGTDLHILSDPPGHPATIGGILGHEFVAEVAEIGSEVTNVNVGQRVAVRPIVTCGTCQYCLKGIPNHCQNMEVYGVFKDGGLAEFVVVPDTACLPFSDNVPLEQAALAEPLACVMSAVEKAAVKPGESVVVLGAGAIGLLFTGILKAAGAGQVIVVEPSQVRGAVARRMGAAKVIDPTAEDAVAALEQLLPSGADVVIDAVGSQFPVALKVAGRRARVILFGQNNNAEAPIKQHVITDKELVIMGNFVGQTSFPAALRLLESGVIDFSPIVSHVIPLAEIGDRFAEVRGGDVVKAIVTI